MHACTVVESEIVTLRRDSEASVAAARESFSISLGSLEEAVRSLDEASETPAFATIGKKPAVPKRRPVSMTGEIATVFLSFSIANLHEKASCLMMSYKVSISFLWAVREKQ